MTPGTRVILEGVVRTSQEGVIYVAVDTGFGDPVLTVLAGKAQLR